MKLSPKKSVKNIGDFWQKADKILHLYYNSFQTSRLMMFERYHRTYKQLGSLNKNALLHNFVRKSGSDKNHAI